MAEPKDLGAIVRGLAAGTIKASEATILLVDYFADSTTTRTDATVSTQPPAVAEKKFILLQKRFWFALLALLAVTGLAWFNGARTPAQFASSDGVVPALLGFLAVVGIGGGIASSWKGSKPTALSPSEAKASTVLPPAIESTVTTETTTTKGPP